MGIFSSASVTIDESAIIEFPLKWVNAILTATVTLSGVSYNVECYYNTRLGQWTLNLKDRSNNDIFTGMRMLTGVLINKNYVATSSPSGSLFIIDTLGKNDDPSRDNLGYGKRFRLLYAELTVE